MKFFDKIKQYLKELVENRKERKRNEAVLGQALALYNHIAAILINQGRDAAYAASEAGGVSNGYVNHYRSLRESLK